MSKFRKMLALLIAASAALSVTACAGSSEGGNNNNEGGGGTTTTTVGSFEEATAPPIDETAETGTVKYLTYETTFETDTGSSKTIALFESRYGGQLVVDSSVTSTEYFQKLATYIATGDSPDLVRYEWIAFPHGMSYNMFTPLDDYIDLDDPLWSGVKDIAEQFAYNGKHFYVPHHIGCSFALNYNNRVLEENGMSDPMTLLQSNTWTWSSFEDMLKRWKDIDPVNHIAYNGVGGMSFVLTTGQKAIEVKNGEIINNLRNSDIQRCMSWLENMRKNGLLAATPEQVAAGAVSGYVAPAEAFVDGNLLFLGMEPYWTFTSAKEALDNQNIPNEIKFVPFPRDEQADTYYQGTDTNGFMIPAGAQNVKGAMDWINLNRSEEIDPDNIAKEKAVAIKEGPDYYPVCPNSDCNDTVNPDSKGRHTFTEEENEAGMSTCPNCGTPRKEKYKVVWSEEQYDLWLEMRGEGDRFTLLFDNCYGFGSDVSQLFQGGDAAILDGPVFSDVSYTSAVEARWNMLEGYLQPYRDRMAADARGEEITTTPPAEA